MVDADSLRQAADEIEALRRRANTLEGELMLARSTADMQRDWDQEDALAECTTEQLSRELRQRSHPIGDEVHLGGEVAALLLEAWRTRDTVLFERAFGLLGIKDRLAPAALVLA